MLPVASESGILQLLKCISSREKRVAILLGPFLLCMRENKYVADVVGFEECSSFGLALPCMISRISKLHQETSMFRSAILLVNIFSGGGIMSVL